MSIFESRKDKELRQRIREEESQKFAAAQEKEKESRIRAEEKARLESGGMKGLLKNEAVKLLKEASKKL